MKDNFSAQSVDYARYRPTYPPEVFQYLNSLVAGKDMAWDCGTGNGQVARELAKSFRLVYATDISQSQLDNALRLKNIHYSVQAAEQTSFADHIFDLIIVAQAIHWFDFERFYSEVRRTAKLNALICVIGYGRPEISDGIDAVINDFYQNTIGKYWDKERRFIDENYRTIPFPFPEIAAPEFVNVQEWSVEHVIGYLNTWSAVQHYIRENGVNPVDALKGSLRELWGSETTKTVRFPLLLRIGRMDKAA